MLVINGIFGTKSKNIFIKHVIFKLYLEIYKEQGIYWNDSGISHKRPVYL